MVAIGCGAVVQKMRTYTLNVRARTSAFINPSWHGMLYVLGQQ
jgi:hypothetical protein